MPFPAMMSLIVIRHFDFSWAVFFAGSFKGLKSMLRVMGAIMGLLNTDTGTPTRTHRDCSARQDGCYLGGYHQHKGPGQREHTGGLRVGTHLSLVVGSGYNGRGAGPGALRVVPETLPNLQV